MKPHQTADHNGPDFIYKESSKQFARDNFWAQVKRTVNGQPISEQEINLIIDQITRVMQFSPQSHLLDLGCGNGALAARLFPQLAGYTGVDYSAYLLGIANEYFKPRLNIEYIEEDVRTFSAHHIPTETFDKVLIYGCMSYFRREEFAVLLRNLSQRFPRVTTVFVGNIPDIKSAPDFFAARQLAHYELDNPQTPIGIWWAQEEVLQLGADTGFAAQCLRMPPDFYGHRYRFDAIFRKAV